MEVSPPKRCVLYPGGDITSCLTLLPIPYDADAKEETVSTLFTPGRIGALALPNRLVRSATAERMADADGRPKPRLAQIYQELARGGVGLIITGHMYVHPSGKAHPEMTGIHSDELIPSLAELADAAHREGGRVVVQINHGGMQCSPETVSETFAPSAVDAPFLNRPAREMTPDEIIPMTQAYGQAARRAQEAGFDGVQIHGAHGYLISQFLSPFVNHRTDEWGGDVEGRMRFLRSVCQNVRKQVGPDYPMLIKLGMMDGLEGGLTAEEGVQVVAALEEMGLDGMEISGGIGGGRNLNTRTGIRSETDEAYFRPLARQARPVTRLPIILVGGFRSRRVMEEVLVAGDADFISLSRPLICEPGLPNRLRTGLQERSACISANLCWPEGPGEGIACRCPIEKDRPNVQ
jgi:2,4-dienoyl-CoA reductase-like NADH-dependent reductase (Old Yellow Enzyme family)